ncbi:MAG: FG-GAP-like repeat-containing protein [Anaerolineae bacterium]
MYSIAGDFDGDHKADIVSYAGEEWFFYKSDGSTSPERVQFTRLPTNLGAYCNGNAGAIGQGDFDGDGKLDLVCYQNAAWDFRLARGVVNGVLTFDAVSSDLGDLPMTPGFFAYSAATADYNGDGRADLAVFNTSISAWDIRISMPTATGLHFERVGNNLDNSYALYTSVIGFQGDFDGDGRADLARWVTAANNWEVRLSARPQTLYVDDDYRPAGTNDGHTWGVDAFGDIQSAVSAAQAGSTIHVGSGVYGPFEIGQFKDGLSVLGIDPDAVFVQGDPEISIHDSVGVRLSGLARRGATGVGVRLHNAGQEEFRRPGASTVLDRLVIQGAGKGIVMDALSALTLRDSTIVGAVGAQQLISVTAGAPPTGQLSPWETLAAPTAAVAGTIAAADGAIYALPSAAPPFTLYRYDVLTNSWLQRASMPDGGRTTLSYSAVGGSDGALYVASVGVDAACTQTFCPARPAFYRYQPATDTWQALSGALFPSPNDGIAVPPALTSDGADALYAVSPIDSGLYRYDIASGAATKLTTLPDYLNLFHGSSIAWANGVIYIRTAFEEQSWYAYNLATSAFQKLADAPLPMGDSPPAWDGAGTIYARAIATSGSSSLLAYSIAANAWTAIPYTILPLPGGFVRQGAYLYVATPGDAPQNAFMRYGPLNAYPRQLTLDHVAFAAPAAAAAPQWLNLSAGFGDFDTTGSQWVGGGAWSPAPPQPPIAFDAARFVDPVHGVYRAGAGSALTAGYRTYRAAAHVSPIYCASCRNDGYTWGQDAFASIQAAIGSGAGQVLLGPGVYQEPFSLVSGVQVIGSGADATIVSGAPISPTAIVQADGISGATLARLTVAGSGGGIGVHLKNNARAVTVARAVIRQTGDAIRVEGGDPASPLRVVNDTLVNNTNGVVNPGCGAVEVRNSVFAFNPGAALDLQSCAATRLHTYNLFWRNGRDLALDGSAVGQPGAGEVFADPRFEDLSRHDYRPRVGSPAIDAGDPYDPTPPGSGGRVDIGYAQTGQASFYADDSYCATCVNDGLDWGVDAFGTIQDAVAAASRFQSALGVNCQRSEQCGLPLTVGVGPGVYAGSVSLPSDVRLIGSGADKTVIDGGGSPQSVIRIANALHVEVSGLTISGQGLGNPQAAGIEIGNGSHFITVTGALIRNNWHGLWLAGATGLLLNNTIVGNGGDGIASTANSTWFNVRDNIIARNGANGLQTNDGSQLFSDYNLVFGNLVDYSQGLAPGPHDLVGKDPQFANPAANDYRLQRGSPAVDAGDPPAPVPIGGGKRVDIGYSERLAAPLTLLLGKEGATCASGAAGIASVEVGLSRVVDGTQPVTATLPLTWTPATVSAPGQVGAYWSASLTPSAGDGLYRLYARSVDGAGNRVTDPRQWFRSELIADSVPPQVTWLAPSDGLVTAAAAITIAARVSDYADTGRGTRDNVAAVSFLVDGVPLAADPVGDPAAADDGQGRVYRATVPLSDGRHVVIVVARDRAGNETRSPARTVTATTPTDLATITSPADGAAGSPGMWTVEGYARFTSATGPGAVTLYANGQPVGVATLAAPLGALTKWTAVFSATTEGVYTLAAVAQRMTPGALASAATNPADLEPGAAELTVTSPSASSEFVVTQTLALAGTAARGAAGRAAHIGGLEPGRRRPGIRPA